MGLSLSVPLSLSHPPVGLAAERLLLVLAGGGDRDLVSVHVRGLGRHRRQLALLSRLPSQSRTKQRKTHET